MPTDPILAAGGFGEVARRRVVAMLIGCALGINRDLRNKPAGLRTHALVALGSALIVVTSIVLAHAVTPPDAGSVLRVVQGVITGIGFLGGGVILRDRETQSVTGLTTAATIWISACLGLTCGAGQWQLKHGDTRTIAYCDPGTLLDRFYRRELDIRPGDALRCRVDFETSYGPDHEVLSERYRIVEILEVLPAARNEGGSEAGHVEPAPVRENAEELAAAD